MDFMLMDQLKNVRNVNQHAKPVVEEVIVNANLVLHLYFIWVRNV